MKVWQIQLSFTDGSIDSMDVGVFSSRERAKEAIQGVVEQSLKWDDSENESTAVVGEWFFGTTGHEQPMVVQYIDIEAMPVDQLIEALRLIVTSN